METTGPADPADRPGGGWVAPEAAPAPAPTAPPAPPATPGPAGAPGSGLPAVALRPLTAPDLVDGAFTVLKSQPRKIVTVVAWFVIPVQVAAAWLQRDLLGGNGILDAIRDPSVAEASSSSGDSGAAFASIIVLLGSSIALPFVAGAIAKLVAAQHAGRDLTAREALAAAGRRWWALLLSWVVVHVLEVVAGAFFVLPGVAVMTLSTVAAPAIVVEDLGPIRGIRRSWQLVRRRFFAALGVTLLAGLVVYILGQALNLVPSVLALVLGLDKGWIALGAGGAAVALVTTPVVASATVLLYLDLRVRTEGLDLELDAGDVFARAR